LRDFLCEREDPRGLYNLESLGTVEDMVRETPRIYVALEDQEVDHQSTVIKVEGKIAKQSISILIDLGSNHSYVMSRIVEVCCLAKKKHDKSWLVQLVTGGGS
jgi:hypothetical protein